jgi:nucleotide-binding universal stress UspA family protein
MAKKNGILLVPVDGSDCALRALTYACRRFKAGGHEAVVALNVQMPMPPSGFVTRKMIDEHHEQLSEEVLDRARAVAARLKVQLTCATAVESPAKAIVSFVRRRNGDEIVMGTRGLGRIGNLLMGSTATRVVQLADVPVTLIK